MFSKPQWLRRLGGKPAEAFVHWSVAALELGGEQKLGFANLLTAPKTNNYPAE